MNIPKPQLLAVTNEFNCVLIWIYLHLQNSIIHLLTSEYLKKDFISTNLQVCTDPAVTVLYLKQVTFRKETFVA